MLSGGKRVAYARIPAVDVLFSGNDFERGLHCGKLQTVFLKVFVITKPLFYFIIFFATRIANDEKAPKMVYPGMSNFYIVMVWFSVMFLRTFSIIISHFKKLSDISFVQYIKSMTPRYRNPFLFYVLLLSHC